MKRQTTFPYEIAAKLFVENKKGLLNKCISFQNN